MFFLYVYKKLCMNIFRNKILFLFSSCVCCLALQANLVSWEDYENAKAHVLAILRQADTEVQRPLAAGGQEVIQKDLAGKQVSITQRIYNLTTELFFKMRAAVKSLM